MVKPFQAIKKLVSRTTSKPPTPHIRPPPPDELKSDEQEVVPWDGQQADTRQTPIVNLEMSGTINVGGNISNNITVNEPISILHQLEKDLRPVAAAYDSATPSATRRETCFEGTRVDILQEIENWIHGQSHTQAPIYVLDGVAGIGKSTIAQTVASRTAQLSILGASFFFRRDEEERSTGIHFFSTIAYQLSHHNDEIAHRVFDAVKLYPDIRQKDIPTQFSVLILNPLQKISPTTSPTLVVIDALDECDGKDAKFILKLLGQNISSIPNLKFLITSRPESHIQDVLDCTLFHERFHLHDIETSIVESDIRLYLDFHLSRDQVSKAFPRNQPPWQPTTEEKKKLYNICGTLFIVASTATKFILNTKRPSPAEQCARLLRGVSSTDYSGSKCTDVLDITYIQILLSASSNDDGDVDDDSDEDSWSEHYRAILGAIISLQNPLPCRSLAELLGVTEVDVEGILRHLHSLVAPSGLDRVFRVHHKSFPDFITSKQRIQKALERVGRISNGTDTKISKFYLDLNEHHRNMARRCFRAMRMNLKQNMCGLSPVDWGRDRDDMEDIFRKRPIPVHVSYACLHWASHLSSSASGLDLELIESVCSWASNNILSWLETLSIIDEVDASHHILEKADSVISCEKPLIIRGCAGAQDITAGLRPQSLSSHTHGANGEAGHQVDVLINDCARFVRTNAALLRLSPMHVYSSGMLFTPVETSLYQLYAGQASVRLVSGAERKWRPTWAVLSGHSGSVTAIAFSPDGSQLASGSDDRTVRLWDSKSGSHLSTFEGHSDKVTSVAFLPDGSWLASGSNDRTVMLWDVKLGSHLITLEGHGNAVTSIAVSPDGSRLASGSNDRSSLELGSVRLWDAKSGSHLSTLNGHVDSLTSIAFSPDGAQVASGSKDRTVRLWDAKSGSHLSTLQGHGDSVTSIAFSPDGLLLASGSDASGKPSLGLKQGTGRLWDAKTGSCICILHGHRGSFTSIAFSPDGSQVASGSNDRTIRLWVTKSGSHLSTLEGHSDKVTSVAFSPDGSRLASGSNDRTVRLWDLKSPSRPPTLGSHSNEYLVNPLAFSPDGLQLAFRSDDRTVCLWDAMAGSHLFTFEGHSSTVASIAFSPDGLQLASGAYDTTIQLWDTKSGLHLSTFQGHRDCVSSLAFSPDRSQLVSGSHDGKVSLWDLKSGSHLSVLTSIVGTVESTSFSPDGFRVAVGSNDRRVDDGRTVQLWDAKTGSRLPTSKGDGAWVTSTAFSPDGSTLASRSIHQTVQLWDTRSGSRLSIFGHPYDILELGWFIPNTAPSSHHTITGTHVLSSKLLLLVQRRKTSPYFYGLAVADNVYTVTQVSIVPVCWFSVDVKPVTFAVNYNGSLVAIYCTNGRTLILDTHRLLS